MQFNAFCELHNEAIKLEHGYTTAGHPVGCAAVLATIEEIERCNFVERSREMGQYMLEKLHTLFGKKQCHELIDNIRGIGLMVSINFKHVGIRFSNSQEATRGIARVLYRMLQNRGILVYPDSEYNIIIAPPFIIGKEEIDTLCNELYDTVEVLYMLRNSSIKLVEEDI